MNQSTGVTAPSPGATGVTTPSPGVEPSGGNVAPDAIVQANPEEPKEPEHIPYVRFKQEVEEKRALKSQVDQLAAQQKQALQLIQQLATRTQQPQQVQQTQDPEAELAKSAFGNDDDGKAAFEAVRRVIQYELKNAQKGLKEEISQSTQQMVQGLLGNVAGSLQTSQTLDQMQRSGLLDETAKTQIASQMGQILQTNPEWQGHQSLLLDKIYMDMVRQGSIQPGRQQVNQSDPVPRHMPMQPGGGVVTPRQQQQQSSAAIKQAEDAELNEIRNMFSRTFGDMSVEDMRKSVGVLPRSNRVVNTPTGEAVEEEILHGAYTFKRR